ncbi:BOI-related E3 ubiquitin-protein ligase 1-like [Tasmannia lanceolata]|uniref:BOI-related E3 ubiquitin-protein ligase 1-like n=1 Tax=Tasmannia lanceolata TaxID=3420 RepID=UPI0040632884
MAVEAHHHHLFQTKQIGNREIINAIENNSNLYNTHMGFGSISGSIPIPAFDNLIPFYNSSIDSIPATDSGLTSNLSATRKWSREHQHPYLTVTLNKERTHVLNNPFSFLGEEAYFQIQQQQLEMDRFISHHTEKVRLELAEKRRRHGRRLFAVVEEGMMKRLKAKEEQIEKMGKLNWVLEERVKSLYVENQIWKELAQTNEATANELRSNLEQVLAQVRDERGQGLRFIEEDAESCCDSRKEDEKEEEEEDEEGMKVVKNLREEESNKKNRWCRNCREEESCVLFLPCRHLCLCTACGSTLHTCPICKSNKNASVHVNMS